MTELEKAPPCAKTLPRTVHKTPDTRRALVEDGARERPDSGDSGVASGASRETEAMLSGRDRADMEIMPFRDGVPEVPLVVGPDFDVVVLVVFWVVVIVIVVVATVCPDIVEDHAHDVGPEPL